MSQNELDNKLDEFIQRLRTIEGEIQILNEDKKELFDEYKDVFEPKVIREAVRAVKVRMKLGDSVAQLDQIIDKLQDKLTV
jgi:uncharacterized protein (UPF0335 family)